MNADSRGGKRREGLCMCMEIGIANSGSGLIESLAAFRLSQGGFGSDSAWTTFAIDVPASKASNRNELAMSDVAHRLFVCTGGMQDAYSRLPITCAVTEPRCSQPLQL